MPVVQYPMRSPAAWIIERTASPSRRAVLLALSYDSATAKSLAAPLGLSGRMVERALSVVKRDRALAQSVAVGHTSLDAAYTELIRRGKALSVGPTVLDEIAKRIESITSHAPRRAVELASAAKERGLVKNDIHAVRRRLGINPTTLKRARIAFERDPNLAARMRAGEAALGEPEAVTRIEPSVRVDASWVGREVSRKLEAALDAITELPLAADVADLLKNHSSLTAEKLDRAINWLGELRHAFGR